MTTLDIFQYSLIGVVAVVGVAGIIYVVLKEEQ
jgi:hypothetical protein